jgi:hypothetical protein
MELLRYLSSALAALSAAFVAVVLFASPALAAGSALTPSAQTVQAGETIGLSVTGFKPCRPQASPVVVWDQSSLSYNPVAGSLTANDFKVEFAVPPGSVGPHVIAVGCPKAALQQQVTVQVVAAALAAFPLSLQAGGRVTLTGSGFLLCTDPAGTTTVELSANGTPPTTVSGSNGAFQQTINIPSSAPGGPDTVTAQCSAQPGSDLTMASVNVVTLALSPSSGIPGTTISVTGAGYTQCHEAQAQLLRGTAQAVAASSPVVPAGGGFTAEVTVPPSAAVGTNYQVDAGCYPAAAAPAALAIEPFAVTSPASSASPTPSSTSPSPSSASPTPGSTSPSPAHSGTTTSSSTPPQSSQHTGGLWALVALLGGAGLALGALSLLHGRRGPRWVNRHLRVVAGSAGPLSADVEHRPGAASVSVGLEPHVDHRGHQQYEEVTAQ